MISYCFWFEFVDILKNILFYIIFNKNVLYYLFIVVYIIFFYVRCVNNWIYWWKVMLEILYWKCSFIMDLINLVIYFLLRFFLFRLCIEINKFIFCFILVKSKFVWFILILLVWFFMKFVVFGYMIDRFLFVKRLKVCRWIYCVIKLVFIVFVNWLY